MTIKPLAIFLAFPLALSGCGLFGEDGMFRNRGSDYLAAGELPPLEVPEDLDSDSLGQLYRIPEVSNTAVLDEDVSATPRPEPLGAGQLEEQVRIQSLGDERWILTNRPPSEVWPRIRNILTSSGIPTTRAEGSQGEIDTDWLRFEGDEEYHHRFRLFVQPGVQPSSTEIEVVHDQKPAEGEASAQWPSDSVSDEREKNMVDVLANALAADISSGTVSLLAQNIGGEEKVEVLTPGGAEPYMLLKLDFDRAWASVGYSLERGGFTTLDQNRSEGLFYVNYTPEDEDKPGFFRRLFSFGGDSSAEDVNYQVHVVSGDKGIEVRVTDENGNAVERSQAIRLLKDVRANLS